MTGYTDFEDLVKAVNGGGIYAFIPKPWSPSQLRSVVRHAVERYELQRKLLQEQALLEALMMHTPDLISIKDSRGRYVRINQAYCSALGAEHPSSLLGLTDQQWGRMLFREPQSDSSELLRERPELDQTKWAERTSRWYSTTRVMTPETPAGNSFQLEISRDITERLDASRRLEEHSKRLENINERLSSVSYIVAHHLQEPLRAIGSFVNLLDRRELLKPGAEEYVGFVKTGVVRAKALMRDFSMYLDLFQPLRKMNLTLAVLVEEAWSELSSCYPTRCIILTGDATLCGNASTLVRLFVGLLGTVLPHGTLNSSVRVVIDERESEVLVQIDDEGAGIAAEDRKALLELWEAGSEGVESDLSVALCQRIAEAHDGHIWLEEAPCEGLRACAKLARHPDAQSDTPKRTSPIIDGRPGPAVCDDFDSQLDRMKSFAATAAHDLHEPLRIVSGYLSLLDRREGSSLTQQGREYLGFALQASKRMRSLIDGLLLYSVSGRSDRGELRPLEQVLADVRADLALAVSEHDAVFDLDSSVKAVRIWELEGRQLLSNLIANSLKYHSSRRPEIRITVVSVEKEHRVVVEDNGLGVPENLRHAIFEPFVRGDHEEPRRGVGLGLATCARIVLGWKGRIWCEESPGGGSRFVFTIPIS